eukprot:gene7108-10951_t
MRKLRVAERVAKAARENPEFKALVGPFTEKEQRAVIRAASAAPKGLLHGKLVGVKDVYHCKGYPTRAGTPFSFEGAEGYVVGRVKRAGGTILGKTVTTELQYLHPADTVHPYWKERTPGGSSVGSAVAVALGWCDVALGTQTHGSVIRPAAYNGVLGMKPTRLRVSPPLQPLGFLPFSAGLDTPGFFSKSLADMRAVCRAVLAGQVSISPHACAGPPSFVLRRARAVDARSFRAKPLTLKAAQRTVISFPAARGLSRPRPFRVGVPSDAYCALSALDVRAMLEAAVRGHSGGPGCLQLVPAPAVGRVTADVEKVLLRQKRVASTQAFLQHAMLARDHGALLSAEAQALLNPASEHVRHPAELVDLLYENEAFACDLYEAMEADDIDALLAPANSAELPPLRSANSTGDPFLAAPWTQANVPVLCLPLNYIAAGKAYSGVSDPTLSPPPVALQIIGRYEENEVVFDTAEALMSI